MSDVAEAFSQPLTEREIQVLEGLSDGLDRRGIGQRLEISELTVKSHLARITKKTGVSTQAGLVGWGFRNGYLDPSDARTD